MNETCSLYSLLAKKNERTERKIIFLFASVFMKRGKMENLLAISLLFMIIFYFSQENLINQS